MKVGKIIKLCKESRMILTVVHDGIQWIGNGHALYPLYHAPKLDKESICYAYDVPEEQQAKITYSELTDVETMCLDDYDEYESETERIPVTIIRNGYTLTPYKTEEGMFFIDNKYLWPLNDEDEVRLYKRTSKGNGTYFAVKAGLVILGIIMPVDIVSEEFVSDIQWLYHECDIIWKNKSKGNNEDFQETLFEREGLNE